MGCEWKRHHWVGCEGCGELGRLSQVDGTIDDVEVQSPDSCRHRNGIFCPLVSGMGPLLPQIDVEGDHRRG